MIPRFSASFVDEADGRAVLPCTSDDWVPYDEPANESTAPLGLKFRKEITVETPLCLEAKRGIVGGADPARGVA